MRKTIQLFIFILFIGNKISYAQLVQTSIPTKLDKGIEKIKVIGKNNDGIVLRFSGKDEIVQLYNPLDLKLKRTRTLSFNEQSGEIQHFAINKSGGTAYYLTDQRKISILKAQLLDENFNVSISAIDIDTFDNSTGLVKSNLRIKTSANLAYSIFYFPVFSGSTIKSMQLVCVNRQMQVMYKVYIPIVQTEREMDIAKGLVDNEGNAYFIYASDQNTNKSDTSDEFVIHKVDKNTAAISKFTAATKKEIFGEPQFDIDDKNKCLNFSGFYNAAPQKSESGANGFFVHSYLLQTNEQVAESYIPFSDAFMKDLTSRVSTINGNTLFTFVIKKIITRQDGGIVVVAESILRDKREQITGGGFAFMNAPIPTTTTIINTYQLNDIITFSTNENKTLDWYAIVRKKQYSENDGEANSSFFIENENKVLRYIFMNDIDYDSDIEQYTVTSQGAVSSSKLIDQNARDIFLFPRNGKQIDKNTCVFPSVKNGVFRLVQVKF